jgi:hypothetical protein
MAIGLMYLLRAAAAWSTAIRERDALAWSALLAIGAVTAATLPRWKAVLHDGVADINSTHVKFAEWINQNYPAGTTMAVFDIGAIGYYAHIRVLDLGGLVDRNYLPYLVQHRVPDYLAERGVEYVILPHTGMETHFGDLLNLLHNPAVRLIPIHTEGGDPVMWKDAFDYTGNAFRQQTLYRIEQVPGSEQNPAATERNTRIAAAAQEESSEIAK